MPDPRADPSLLLCSDPATSSHTALIGSLCRSIHNDKPTAMDELERLKMKQSTPMTAGLKMKQSTPMTAGIEIPAGGTVSGDAGDAESVPVGDSPCTPPSCGCNGRVQRFSGH